MLSAIVLTRNEEKNISECLAALNWADEILVIDSESADRTCELAKKSGAVVFSHPFSDFSAQRNFALQKAKGDWVLFIDADERVTVELAEEIKNITQGNPRGEISGGRRRTPGVESGCVYAIPRKTFFFGKLLRFADARHDAPIRLFPRSRVRWIQPVHEKIETDLPCKLLKNPLLHYSTRDLAHYRQKVMEYVPLELATLRAKGIRANFLSVLIRPAGKFFYLYIWKLGILDGIPGLQYAMLSAWYAFIKHWRYWRTCQYEDCSR